MASRETSSLRMFAYRARFAAKPERQRHLTIIPYTFATPPEAPTERDNQT
jgi:hypothetical protein